MPKLTWDEPENRIYESGVSKGVIYPHNGGEAAPWNGLLNVQQTHDTSSGETYFDGIRVSTSSASIPYKAKIKALTYPKALREASGAVAVNKGIYFSEQPPQSFDLTYTTNVSNANGDSKERVHLVYNAMVLPSDYDYDTEGDSPTPGEFEWEITTVQLEEAGLKPFSHIVLDTWEFPGELKNLISYTLYGGESPSEKAKMIRPRDLLDLPPI